MSSWRSRAGHLVASAVRRGILGGHEAERGVCEACGDGRDGRGAPRRFVFPSEGDDRELVCGACALARIEAYERASRGRS